MSFDFDRSCNTCSIASNVKINGFIKGKNNVVNIASSLHDCQIDLRVCGDDNTVTIGSSFAIKGLNISVGSHVPAYKTELLIEDGFSIESNGNFLLPNSGNILKIGKNCMFSNSVTVRCGDSPHLLFDKLTGAYLDISDGVFIGDHVWVGERVYITKRASIPNDCLVAACAVVTKHFTEDHVVLAGNPARVVRRDVQWIRNHSYLVKDGNYYNSYRDHNAQFLF